jgi:hypothetical protein
VVHEVEEGKIPRLLYQPLLDSYIFDNHEVRKVQFFGTTVCGAYFCAEGDNVGGNPIYATMRRERENREMDIV